MLLESRVLIKRIANLIPVISCLSPVLCWGISWTSLAMPIASQQSISIPTPNRAWPRTLGPMPTVFWVSPTTPAPPTASGNTTGELTSYGPVRSSLRALRWLTAMGPIATLKRSQCDKWNWKNSTCLPVTARPAVRIGMWWHAPAVNVCSNKFCVSSEV